MEYSHRRRVEGASRLMRKKGIEATSVNDVMKKRGSQAGARLVRISKRQGGPAASTCTRAARAGRCPRFTEERGSQAALGSPDALNAGPPRRPLPAFTEEERGSQAALGSPDALNAGPPRRALPAITEEPHLTHGGFYRHFDSKESLVAAALEDAFNEVVDGLQAYCAVEKLAQGGKGAAEENRAAAIRKLSMLAGGVMIARATDTKTAAAVLAACKDA